MEKKLKSWTRLVVVRRNNAVVFVLGVLAASINDGGPRLPV